MVSCGCGTMVSRKTVPAPSCRRRSRAIETAVAALHQPGMGLAPSLPPVKEYKAGQRPIGGDFEHGAIAAVRAATVSRAIEIAVAALHQPGIGICAIIGAGE